MTASDRVQRLAQALEHELRRNILPFWYQTVDQRGGFYGLVRSDHSVDPRSPKGLVMHSRHLWASSSAWMEGHNPLDRNMARHAFRFLSTRLYDNEHQGFWWTVDGRGRPGLDTKVLYGQGFAVYGLAQYYRATGDAAALRLARETFERLEQVGRDRVNGGYYEAVDRTWTAPVVQALSEVDIPCAKSMNTNLHILEAYSTLYRATGAPDVREALEALLGVFERHILVSPEHLGLYFDRDWTPLTDHVSYGHDIEASWLLTEAAEVLGAPTRTEVPRRIARHSLDVLRAEGGSLPNERHGGRLDTDRVWWVQAEALVGMVNAWGLTGDEAYVEAAERVWDWIQRFQIDREHGDWHWLVRADGRPDLSRPKGGLWKTSYHNGRACLEVMQRARRQV